MLFGRGHQPHIQGNQWGWKEGTPQTVFFQRRYRIEWKAPKHALEKYQKNTEEETPQTVFFQRRYGIEWKTS